MNILLLGATGGTGRAIVSEAQDGGHTVTALVRSVSRAQGLEGVRLVEGDARDERALFAALDGVSAVISALGTAMSPFREVTMLSTANRALVSAMKARGVHRLVCITGMGAGDSRGHGGPLHDLLILPLLLRRVYADKNRQEDETRASGLDWVIARPTVLNDGPPKGSIRALTDLSGVHGGTVARVDVARFVVGQADDNTWLHQLPLITS